MASWFRILLAGTWAVVATACVGDTDDDDSPTVPTSDTSGTSDTGTPKKDGCREITLAPVARAVQDGEFAAYLTTLDPDGGDPADIDEVQVVFVESDQHPEGFEASATGTFDLGSGIDANGSTCARCILIFEDPGLGVPTAYFPASGTMVVEDGSTPTRGNGVLQATLSEVTLVEVDIAFGFDYETTPVEDGKCLYLDSASLSYTPGDNQFINAGFEETSAGANPPFEPPNSWLPFGATVDPFSDRGYSNYATQATGSPIFNPANPSDQSALFPGLNGTRGLKTWGLGVTDDGGTTFENSLGTIFQTYAGTVPQAATLTLSGWAYVSSVDPLADDSQGYLVIKCFDSSFGSEFCGGGTGAQSFPITSDTPMDTWIPVTVTVASLPPMTTIVQAGVEFEECNGGACSTVAGAVFWDDLNLTFQP